MCGAHTAPTPVCVHTTSLDVEEHARQQVASSAIAAALEVRGVISSLQRGLHL